MRDLNNRRSTLHLVGTLLATHALAAQTQVDLSTQSKGVDFQSAPYTKPLRSSSTLPTVCAVNELLLLTSAPPGSNIYACLAPNTWVPQGGSAQAVTIQNGSVNIGSRGTLNFASGPGLVNIV